MVLAFLGKVVVKCFMFSGLSQGKGCCVCRCSSTSKRVPFCPIVCACSGGFVTSIKTRGLLRCGNDVGGKVFRSTVGSLGRSSGPYLLVCRLR